MYPVLWEPFGFPISSFGVMMAIGFLVSDRVVARRFAEQGQGRELSSTILVWAVVCGVIGSKIYYAVEFSLRGEGEFFALLFDRAGMVWFGGLIAGTLGVTLATKLHDIPIGAVASAVANAAPFGQACGRIGCFLVGDDYGRPTSEWYGVAFPEGSPPTARCLTGQPIPACPPDQLEVWAVVPTQLLEVAWLVGIGVVLWRRRKTSPFLFAEYAVLAGIGRFVVEFLRVNEPVAFDLTGAQLISLGMMLVGGVFWLRARAARPPASAKGARA
jgi:phosphatidylglycerol:prolipoprotein diacylglycerol transferase